MGAEDYAEVLLRVTDQLCEELGYVDPEPGLEPRTSAAEVSATSHVLDADDAALVARLKMALAKIAVAVADASGPEDSPGRPVEAAIEGVELVMRGELLRGNAARLPRLMPSFVYLVTLPIVEQDRALELSRRTSELIAEKPE